MTAPTVALLSLIVVYAAGVELVTRRVLDPGSKVQRVLKQELLNSAALRPAAPGQPKSVLLAGNSLLDAAVDFPRLNEELEPDWRASRLVVFDTNYTDWHFGLMRLLESGVRPDAIAVFLSPTQLMRNAVRGGYFAHYLMRPEDLAGVVQATGMHPTEASGLLLARYSLFYGIRVQLRNLILAELFPHLPELMRASPAPATPKTQVSREEIELRLRNLDGIAHRYGVRLVLVLPPLPSDDPKNRFASVVEAGARSGVSVLNPLPAGELPRSAFPDGLHAGKEGAGTYTKALGPSLRRWLASSPSQAPGRPAPFEPGERERKPAH